MLHWLLLTVLLWTVNCVQGLYPPPEFLRPHFQIIKNSVCREHAAIFYNALANFTLWAVQLFDASAKYPVGLLSGNGYELGSFDECLAVDVDLEESSGGQLKGQYCLVDIYFNKKDFNFAAHYSSSYNPLSSAWNKLLWDTHFLNFGTCFGCSTYTHPQPGVRRTPETCTEIKKDPRDCTQMKRNAVHWAFCIPNSCTAHDVEKSLAETVARIRPKFQLSVKVSGRLCQTKQTVEETKQFTATDVIACVVAASLILLVVLSTVYEEWFNQETQLPNVEQKHSTKENLPAQFLLCFSVKRNMAYLTETGPADSGFECIHGLRFIFIILVISGHRFLVHFSGPLVDAATFEEGYHHTYNMYALNGMIVIDTFFVYSGLLTAYYMPLELDDKQNLNPFVIWLYRFIRLTPTYFAVLVFHMTVLGKLGSGPLWPDAIGLEQRRCNTNWWLNILYLNNYINQHEMCIYHSWYLAADTHLFMIAVVIIYLMWRYPLVGYILLASASLLALFVPFIVTFINSADPFLLLYPNVLKDIPSSKHFQKYYVASHMRAGPYVTGVAMGFYLYKMKDSLFRVPKVWLFRGHLLCLFMCIGAQYSAFTFYIPGTPYLPISSALYAALHRTIWGCAVAFNVFLLVHGKIDWLHRFLTWHPMVPISRLSYCAYLVHRIPHLYEISICRTPQSPSVYTAVWMLVGDIFFTFLISLCLCMTVEAPFRGIEKILFGIRNFSQTTVEATEMKQVPKEDEDKK